MEEKICIYFRYIATLNFYRKKACGAQQYFSQITRCNFITQSEFFFSTSLNIHTMLIRCWWTHQCTCPHCSWYTHTAFCSLMLIFRYWIGTWYRRTVPGSVLFSKWILVALVKNKTIVLEWCQLFCLKNKDCRNCEVSFIYFFV